MLAFELFVDDRRICLAGMEDWAVMSVILSAVNSGERADGLPREGKLDVSAGGLSENNSSGVAHHARWARVDLQVGSKVQINVVETAEPDPPIHRYRSDRKVQEPAFTKAEIEQMEREDYERLKEKYEPKDKA
jgi:hypothetical protein